MREIRFMLVSNYLLLRTLNVVICEWSASWGCATDQQRREEVHGDALQFICVLLLLQDLWDIGFVGQRKFCTCRSGCVFLVATDCRHVLR